MKVRKVHHVIIFGEGSERYSMIDPNSEALGEAAHTARYDLARLTQTQAYLLCEAFESYQYIASACPTTGLAIDMLRRLRNARDVPAHAPDAKAKDAERVLCARCGGDGWALPKTPFCDGVRCEACAGRGIVYALPEAKDAADARTPLKPEELVGALHDPIHPVSGELRSSKAVAIRRRGEAKEATEGARCDGSGFTGWIQREEGVRSRASCGRYINEKWVPGCAACTRCDGTGYAISRLPGVSWQKCPGCTVCLTAPRCDGFGEMYGGKKPCPGCAACRPREGER